jgi:pilus assembly protein CpaC
MMPAANNANLYRRVMATTNLGRVAALLALAACVISPVQAQPAASGTDQPHGVEFTVSKVSGEQQLIRVPANKAVLVDFNVPLREVRLAKPEIAEVTATSPKQILVTGKAFGTTQLIVWLNDTERRVFDVAVDLELDRLLASIRAAVPRAKVGAHALLDAVVLTGTVPDAASAQRIMEIASVYSTKVMNHMRVAGVQQVLLRCTVAEVNRSSVRQLGFNGWIAGDNLHDMFMVNQLDGINTVNMGGSANFGPIGGSNAIAIPFGTDRQEGLPLRTRPTLSFGFPRVQMQIFIEALRENGLLRVLAEPNLVTISGQEADFLAGGEFPVPVPSDQGVAIQYRKYGVQLRFTPTVLSENVIRLNVAPEVSEPDFTTAVTVLGTTVPGLAQRRVETVVELGSGQTFAIGGLLSERVRGVSRKVPALGDIPVLGSLFSSVDYQADRSELVVLVTPELVEPVSPDQISSVPGTNLVTPNDFELFLLGNLDGASGETRPALRPRVNHTWPVRPSELYGMAAPLKLRGPLGPAGMDEGS